MPNLAINCERLVPKSAWRFGRNAHESEAAEDNCRWSWIQIQRQILLNVHLVGPARGTSNRITPAQLLIRRRIFSSATYISSGHARGTSHRITPAQLLNRRRISSSSTNISSDLNRRRISSSSTYISSDLQQKKRNFSQDHASRVTEQTEDFIFSLVQLYGPARGTSHRIMPAQLLSRQRISSSSTYISSDLQEELLTGSHQHSYWTDGGSRLHLHTTNRTCMTNFSQDKCQRSCWPDGGSRLRPHTSHRNSKRNFSQDHASTVTEQTEGFIFIHIPGMNSQTNFPGFMNHDFR